MVRMKMIGDKPVLDVYLGESQIANITLIKAERPNYFNKVLAPLLTFLF